MTPTEKLQAEAEQLYPDVDETWDYLSDDYRINEVKKFQRAAHVACAEKYTAIIEDYKTVCKVAGVPQLIIDNPSFIKGQTPTSW